MASVAQERACRAAQLRYDDATPETWGCFEEDESDEPEARDTDLNRTGCRRWDDDDGPIIGTDDADERGVYFDEESDDDDE